MGEPDTSTRASSGGGWRMGTLIAAVAQDPEPGAAVNATAMSNV
jgi:hypothetical protein